MKKFIVGNWKMNLNIHEASLFLNKLAQVVPIRRDVEAIICPSFLALEPLSLQINHRQIKLGAQDCYWRDSGAFTGEVSAAQLRGLTQYVLVGHSERRHIFSEDDRDVRFKVQAVMRNGMSPILCVGETEMERDAGDTAHVVGDQVVSGLMNVGSDQLDRLIIAYEPVWAIGSGEMPTTEQINEVISQIRAQICHMFGKAACKLVPILYGGSVNKDNCRDILELSSVDGLLVGGASLKADQFSAMVDIASEIAKEAKK